MKHAEQVPYLRVYLITNNSKLSMNIF